ncbi:MAG: DUF4331 family protein [Gemmatimonadaceae bacterium]|nr:DUF4331 family protein [Gemmatimonadaceae bacterium]
MNAVRLALMSASILVIGLTSACERGVETITLTKTDTVRTVRTDTVIRRDTVRFNEFRTFNQIERLGNPLVAEVLLEFKDHGFHDAGTPVTDRANFSAKVIRFITTVAGRSTATATAIANALLPDMIGVQTDKAANTAGYLGQVLNPAVNYGGRRLQDDAVDLSLGVVFGPILDPMNVSPGLVTDNVPPLGGGPVPTNTFPYLAPPNGP